MLGFGIWHGTSTNAVEPHIVRYVLYSTDCTVRTAQYFGEGRLDVDVEESVSEAVAAGVSVESSWGEQGKSGDLEKQEGRLTGEMGLCELA